MNRTRGSLTSSDPKGSKRRLCRRPPLLLSFPFDSLSFVLPLAQHRSLWAEDRTFQSGPIWVGQPKTRSRNSARGFSGGTYRGRLDTKWNVHPGEGQGEREARRKGLWSGRKTTGKVRGFLTPRTPLRDRVALASSSGCRAGGGRAWCPRTPACHRMAGYPFPLPRCCLLRLTVTRFTFSCLLCVLEGGLTWNGTVEFRRQGGSRRRNWERGREGQEGTAMQDTHGTLQHSWDPAPDPASVHPPLPSPLFLTLSYPPWGAR